LLRRIAQAVFRSLQVQTATFAQMTTSPYPPVTPAYRALPVKIVSYAQMTILLNLIVQPASLGLLEPLAMNVSMSVLERQTAPHVQTRAFLVPLVTKLNVSPVKLMERTVGRSCLPGSMLVTTTPRRSCALAPQETRTVA